MNFVHFSDSALGVPAPAQGGGWFDVFVEKLNLDGLLSKLGLSVSEALMVTYFFAGSFFVGFVFKKYFKFIFALIVLVGVLTLFLETQNIIAVDWAALRVLVGIKQEATNVNTLWSTMLTWTKENVYLFLASVFGFMFGYKMG